METRKTWKVRDSDRALVEAARRAGLGGLRWTDVTDYSVVVAVGVTSLMRENLKIGYYATALDFLNGIERKEG